MAKSEARTVGVRTRGRAFAALVAAAALVLTACTAGGQQLPAPAPAPSGSTAAPTEAPAGEARTLVIGATAEPQTLDPTATDAAAGPQALLYNVFETLIRLDSTGKLKPLLAQT